VTEAVAICRPYRPSIRRTMAKYNPYGHLEHFTQYRPPKRFGTFRDPNRTVEGIMIKFWRSAAECLVAALALVSLTAICAWLHFNLTTIALLCAIVVVLLARVGTLLSSITASIIAALCLVYVAPPAFSFRIDDPLDYVAVTTFLVASLTIATLVSKVRKQAEDALSSVSYRVIEAEELERRRIAYDLHEDICQRLTMLSLKIEQVKTVDPNLTVDASIRMDAVLKQSLEIGSDIRTLAHELYSPRLEYLCIAGVMRSFCTDFGKRRGLEIDFRSDGVPSLIPPDVSLCLFRVLQEALHNAVKHGGVRKIDARLWGTSGEIHLTVSDGGVGFNLETARKAGGLGFHRMQERLKLVKGMVSIESQPNRGATIHARVPVSSGTNSKRGSAEAPEPQAAD
jgi:signal transduction histidine kinase